jgi:hypothetical protein
MKLKKQAGQFNTYSAELTYGEILVLRNGLQNSPGMGPEADEMLEGFNWYLEKMPEPGEEGDKKEGTSDSPNMAKDKADDALSPMLLEPAPGQEDTVAGEDDRDEETLADRLGVNAEEEELPEPPTR